MLQVTKLRSGEKKITAPLEIEIIRETTRANRLIAKLMLHPLSSLLV